MLGHRLGQSVGSVTSLPQAMDFGAQQPGPHTITLSMVGDLRHILMTLRLMSAFLFVVFSFFS